jgi:hypothetical protein
MIEAEIRDRIGIGKDVEFQDVGERKIQKGEFVQEHEVINLVKTDQNMVKEDCKLID